MTDINRAEVWAHLAETHYEKQTSDGIAEPEVTVSLQNAIPSKDNGNFLQRLRERGLTPVIQPDGRITIQKLGEA